MRFTRKSEQFVLAVVRSSPFPPGRPRVNTFPRKGPEHDPGSIQTVRRASPTYRPLVASSTVQTSERAMEDKRGAAGDRCCCRCFCYYCFLLAYPVPNAATGASRELGCLHHAPLSLTLPFFTLS